MKKYTVYVKEVYIQAYDVEANSPEEAKLLVADGEGELIENEYGYSHTLDSDTWNVVEVEEK